MDIHRRLCARRGSRLRPDSASHHDADGRNAGQDDEPGPASCRGGRPHPAHVRDARCQSRRRHRSGRTRRCSQAVGRRAERSSGKRLVTAAKCWTIPFLRKTSWRPPFICSASIRTPPFPTAKAARIQSRAAASCGRNCWGDVTLATTVPRMLGIRNNRPPGTCASHRLSVSCWCGSR